MENPILSKLNGNNQNAIVQKLMNTNPQFGQFVRENQGLTVEQIANKYGLDINQVRKLLK